MNTRVPRRLRRAIALMGAVALTALVASPVANATAPTTTSAPAPAGGRYTPVMVVMDTSGSMADAIGSSSKTKIQAARTAVNAVAAAVGPDQQFGLIAYPGTSGTVGSDGCEVGDVVLPLGPPDPALASAAVRHLQADGGTPTSAALVHASQVLQSSGVGHSVVVLVSDGQANCGAPVCETVKKLLRQGIQVTVNTVGFDLEGDPDAKSDLECVAKATGGAYVDAADAEALREALLKAATSYLQIDAAIPKTAAPVSGTASDLGAVASVTVTNTGSQQARDVQVSLDFTHGKAGGAVPVGTPVLSIGNLEPGRPREVKFRLRPTSSTVGQTMRWIAAATSADGDGAQSNGSMTIVKPGEAIGAVLNVEGPVAILGDSYSSGEGARVYLDGTSEFNGSYEGECHTPAKSLQDILTPDPRCRLPGVNHTSWNACHQSSLAYGAVLFGDRVHNFACSGAVTANYDHKSQRSGNQDVPLQSKQLQKLVDSPHPPGLVLLTFGGNDVGFKDIITHCVIYLRACNNSDRDHKSWGQGVLARIPDILNDLVGVYQQIDSQVNSADAIAKRGGKVARIVVLPYVRILPKDDSNAPGNCFVGFNGDEVRFLNQLQDKLNSTIEEAVGNQTKAGRPFYFADDVIDAFQPDHTMCASHSPSFVNTTKANFAERNLSNLGGLSGRVLPHNPLGVPGLVSAAIRAGILGGNEQAHPNAAGYEAEAEALAGWSLNAHVLDVTGPPPPLKLHVTNHPLLNGPDIGVGELQPAGGTVTLQGAGFEPGTQIVVRLDSVPHVTGTATVADDGTVTANADIPVDTPPGSHHVTLFGLGKDGELRTVSHPIHVLPPLTGLAIAFIVLGMALIVFWAATRRRRRVRRN